jgi:hypothetical protein
MIQDAVLTLQRTVLRTMDVYSEVISFVLILELPCILTLATDGTIISFVSVVERENWGKE